MGAREANVVVRRIVAGVVDWSLLAVLATGIFVGGSRAVAAERVEPLVPGGDPCTVFLAADEVGGCARIGDRLYVAGEIELPLYLAVGASAVLLLVVWQGFRGVTPGKLLLGLRCVGPGGLPPGGRRALVRGLLWAVDGAPWVVPLVGPVAVVLTSDHRRVGDRVAGTSVVVRRGDPEPEPEDAGAAESPTTWGPVGRGIVVGALVVVLAGSLVAIRSASDDVDPAALARRYAELAGPGPEDLGALVDEARVVPGFSEATGGWRDVELVQAAGNVCIGMDALVSGWARLDPPPSPGERTEQAATLLPGMVGTKDPLVSDTLGRFAGRHLCPEHEAALTAVFGGP